MTKKYSTDLLNTAVNSLTYSDTDHKDLQKRGNRRERLNYGEISLFSIVYKIMASKILNRLNSLLALNILPETGRLSKE